MSYQRVSAGMGFSKIGRDRLLFRHESAARVRWQQGVGVWVDAKGSRSAFPVVGNEEARKEMKQEMNDPDCIFCKISNGVLPASFVYEDEKVFGIMSLDQPNPYKVLVVPRLHSETIYDLPAAEAALIFQATVK